MKYAKKGDRLVKLESAEIMRWQAEDFGEVVWKLVINKDYPSCFSIHCESITEARKLLNLFYGENIYSDLIVEL